MPLETKKTKPRKNNTTIAFYNNFSYIYDSISNFQYRATRIEAINQLGLEQGDTVIDLFCGTGQSFKLISEKIGSTGKIIGIDGSSGMLSKAEKKVKNNGFLNQQVQLIEQDLRKLKGGFFKELSPQDSKLKIIIVLGHWKILFDQIFQEVPDGTRFSTVDLYCEKKSFSAKFINWFGGDNYDCSEKNWEILKSKTDDYKVESYHFPSLFVKAAIIVASGTKITSLE